MTSPRVIRDQIITILKAADPKNAAGTGVKHWFTAEPQRSTWPGFPFGWVEFSSGQSQRKDVVISSSSRIDEKFIVAVVDKHIDSEKAEASVLEFLESVEAALDDDQTLGGLVIESYVGSWEKAKWFEQKTDYSFRAVGITLHARRRG